jgi:MraZ protein
MAEKLALLRGEFVRKLDERGRVALPEPFAQDLCPIEEAICVVAKERAGSLSIWRRDTWAERIERPVELVEKKLEAGRLANRLADVQTFGRLLSAKSRECRLESKDRLTIPEGFRQFLGVEPDGQCVVVGAAICIEIWNPEAWQRYLNEEIAAFGPLFEQLSS